MIFVRKRNRGVTVTEMLVAVAILGTIFMLGRVGVLLVNNMAQASAVGKVQQEAQLILYTMTKDVRNSVRIVNASATTLTLNMLNTTPGFTNPTLFDEVNITTLTYTFTTSGNETYLRKTLLQNHILVEDKKLLRNMLLEPSAQNYLFNVCDREGINSLDGCPLPGELGYPPIPRYYYGVDIRLRMSPLFVQNSEVVYSAKEIRRSGVE